MGDETTHTVDMHNLVKNIKSHKILIVVLILCICAITAGLGFGGYYIAKEIIEIKDAQKIQYDEHKQTNQFLLSTIDWSVMRTKKILYMRDVIINNWIKTKFSVDRDLAYRIAETILKECENYTYIDPFFVLSIQKTESGFKTNLVSKMGAIGLCQIMPTTGKLLCGLYGVAYHDSLLYNSVLSTRFCVKLIDVAFSTYHSWESVLAEYNGGPWQVYYYCKEKEKLDPETKNFVPTVLSEWQGYQDRFKDYRVDSVLLTQ